MQAFGNPAVNTRINQYGFYGEDQWKVTPRLTASVGLRYEYSQLPQPKVCNQTFTQTCHINSPDNEWMPRIGLAYRLDNKTVIACRLRHILCPRHGSQSPGPVYE